MPQTTCYAQPQVYYANTATTTGTNQIWYKWNLPYPQLSATSITASDQVWQTWVNTPSITTTTQIGVYTYTDEAWQQWVNYPSVTTGYNYQPVQQTPEQLQQTRERNERYEAERRQQRQEREAARTRARILLGEFLTDEQKAELERHGHFRVTGSKGRRYCIRTTSQAGNVDLLGDDGKVQATLCAHPRGYLPDGDAWLVQMLEIRHDEEHFLRTANVHRGRLPAGAR